MSRDFVKNGEFYLNEINFRNGANSYITSYGSVNIIYLYYLLVCGKDISKLKSEVDEEYYFQEDESDFKLVLNKEISLIEYLKSFKKAKVHLFINKHDLKPFMYKYIYAILRRIKKKKLEIRGG